MIVRYISLNTLLQIMCCEIEIERAVLRAYMCIGNQKRYQPLLHCSAKYYFLVRNLMKLYFLEYITWPRGSCFQFCFQTSFWILKLTIQLSWFGMINSLNFRNTVKGIICSTISAEENKATHVTKKCAQK